MCQWVVSQEELQEIQQYGSAKHPCCSDRGGGIGVGEEDAKWWRSRPAIPRSVRDGGTSHVMGFGPIPGRVCGLGSGRLWVLGLGQVWVLADFLCGSFF